MKPKVWCWIIVTMFVIAVTSIGFVKYSAAPDVTPVSEKEEIAAAESLLARKLAGPRYFNAPVAGLREEGGPWISAADARLQVPEITAERKLDPESALEIGRLIGQMTERHPSRKVGGERISLLHLNLSLDSIKHQ